jgi:entericidin A
VLSVFFAGSLAACNTVKGAGQDVQKVGGKLEDSADKTGGTGTK